MARTILRDAARLNRLGAELRELVAAIDNEVNVPERYDSTLAGHLASADASLLMTTWETVGRLERWARFEQVSPDRYTRLIPEPSPDAA